MTEPDSTAPLQVHRLRDKGVVRIQWSEEHIGEYPFSYLRGWCPCAACQGHGGEKRFVHAGDSNLEKIELVGNYALQLKWGDGHETGIYTFQYLRGMCPCPDC